MTFLGEEEEAEDNDEGSEEGTGDVKSEERDAEEKHQEEAVEFPDTMVEMSHIGGAQWVLCQDAGVIFFL